MQYIPTFEEYASERGIPLDGSYSSVSDGTRSTIVSYPSDEISFDKDKYEQLMKSMKSKEDYERLTKNRSVKQSYEDYVNTFSKVAKDRATTNIGVQRRREKDIDLDKKRAELYEQYLSEYPEAEIVKCAIDSDGNRLEISNYEDVPKYECKIRHDKNYRIEMDKNVFGKITNVLTDVGDFVAENASSLPVIGQVASEVYKNFAPPTSKFYSDNLINKFSGSGTFHKRKKLSGRGFFDSIFNKAKEYIAIAKQRVVDVSRGIRKDNYQPNVRKLLETIGNDPIIEMYVRRDPIKSFLHTALNLITIGMWNKAREKYNYDKVFHLGLELTIKVSSNGDIVGRYVLEKNEVINLQPAKAINNDTELIKVPMIDSISLNQLLEKTKQRMGPNMFIYDAFTNNCQDFIANVLLANGFADPKVLSYVKQPLEKVLQSLPSYTKTVAKAVTDVAALSNVALHGYGGMFQNQLHKLQISPQKYLKSARHFAKLYEYVPHFLQFSDNPKKKLMYVVDGKKIHFGQSGYMDYILYSLTNPQIADKKRRAYLNRATKISGDWKKDPNSPNNLALKILWNQ